MERPLTQHIHPDRSYLPLDEYESTGGYAAFKKALLDMSPDDIVNEIKEANLRGRGGAGFPAAIKWKSTPCGESAPHPKYVIVNADEMEPGTFKDRWLTEGNPHQLVEGLLIAMVATEADIGYIFLRREYKLSERHLRRAIDECRDKGYIGKKVLDSDMSFDVRLHVSAGHYICGEESALMNALEGKRAIPRARVVFPTVSGLWGRPTVINNAETIANVPHIIANGAEWYKSISKSSDGGTKIYGVSGKVKNPGLWELPMGTPLRELLFDRAGGMKDGLKFRGLLPGGASTDFLVEDHLDVPMDFDSVQKAGSRLGTGTVVVLDDGTCPVGMAHNLIKFFAKESCGWCTPCREGMPWLEKLLASIERGEGKPVDIDILEEHTRLLGPGKTFCLLAPGAMEPLQSALKYFREDFERHITEHRCPWR